MWRVVSAFGGPGQVTQGDVFAVVPFAKNKRASKLTDRRRSPHLGTHAGLEVPDSGRLRPEIWDAWCTAHNRPGAAGTPEAPRQMGT